MSLITGLQMHKAAQVPLTMGRKFISNMKLVLCWSNPPSPPGTTLISNVDQPKLLL